MFQKKSQKKYDFSKIKLLVGTIFVGRERERERDRERVGRHIIMRICLDFAVSILKNFRENHILFLAICGFSRREITMITLKNNPLILKNMPMI